MPTVHITNQTATNISITGHKGLPSLTIAPTASHNTATIDVVDLIGNVLLIDSLKTLVTAASIVVRYGSSAGTIISIADLESFKTCDPFDVDLNEITVRIDGINMKSLTEHSVTLPGDGTRRFYPQTYYFICRTANTLTADGTFDAASTTGGTDMLNAAALTGLNVANEIFRIDVAVTTAQSFPDNCTIFAGMHAVNTGTSGTLDFIVKGVIL